MRNLGNVEIAVFEQQKHGHRWGAMLSPAPAGRACHPVIGRLGTNFGVISAIFRDTGCHDRAGTSCHRHLRCETRRNLLDFLNTGGMTERGTSVIACHRPLRGDFRLVFWNTEHNDRMTE